MLLEPVVGVAWSATVADMLRSGFGGASEEGIEGARVEWEGAVDADLQTGTGVGDGDVVGACGTVAGGGGGTELWVEWYGTL